MRCAICFLVIHMAVGDSPWVDLWKSYGPGGGHEKNITSMWGPSLVVTNTNVTIAFGQCDRSATSHDSWMAFTRSLDGGATWESPRELYGCGSPAGLYSKTTDTIFAFFGECGPPRPPGPPYALAAMNCRGGSVHWQYNDTSQQLRNQHIDAPASPLSVRVCEGAVKPKAGDSLAVGIPPDQPEQCPSVDLEWVLDGTDGYIRHVDTGLCLTVPPHKSAVLEPCGYGKSEGQKYVWNGDTLVLAPGMFRAGECLGYVNNTRDGSDAWPPPEPATDQFNLCVATQDVSTLHYFCIPFLLKAFPTHCIASLACTAVLQHDSLATSAARVSRLQSLSGRTRRHAQVGGQVQRQANADLLRVSRRSRATRAWQAAQRLGHGGDEEPRFRSDLVGTRAHRRDQHLGALVRGQRLGARHRIGRGRSPPRQAGHRQAV